MHTVKGERERKREMKRKKTAQIHTQKRKPAINIHGYGLNEIPNNGNYIVIKQRIIDAVSIGFDGCVMTTTTTTTITAAVAFAFLLAQDILMDTMYKQRRN